MRSIYGRSNLRVTGQGSHVTGHGSLITGHRLQVTNIIISCSAHGKNKTCLLFKIIFSVCNFLVVINNLSVLIVLYYIWKSDGCPFIISLTCNIKKTVFNTTSTIVIDLTWLTLCLQKNAQKFEKKFAPLNFHKRNETDADFAAIEFGRRRRVIYRTENWDTCK